MLGSIIGGIVSAGASLIGGNKQLKATERANQQNAQLQKDFAQNSIRWRVADAKAAGLHPLAALGATGASASPSFQAGDYSFMSQAGQDAGTAINRTLSPRAQTSRYSRMAQGLTLKNMDLKNQLLASQIAKERSAPSPGIPDASTAYLLPGQSSSGAIDIANKKRHAVSNLSNVEYGAVPGTAVVKTPTGYAPVVGKHAKQGMEDMTIPQLQWQVRNNILPAISSKYSAAKSLPKAPFGKKWKYSFWTGEYYLAKDHDRRFNFRGR